MKSRRFVLVLVLALASLAADLVLSAQAPISLFDGKTLEGWDYDPKVWRVEGGFLTGGSTTEKIPKNFFLSTKRSFQNFELKLRIKCSGDPKSGMINSGIQIRSMRVGDGTAMSGYQVDCGAGWFGKLYDEHRRNKVIWAPSPEQQAALDKAIDVFGWNEYRIRAEGRRIQTWINGVHCIDFTETDPNMALDGHIAPQVHSGGACLVQIQEVTIEELPPTPDAPTWKSLGGVEEALRKVRKPSPKEAVPQAAKPMKEGNAIGGVARSATEQWRDFHLPEGYEIELVVQESEGLGKFVSVSFDQRGRMWTQTALEYPVDGNENPAAAEALYAGRGRDKVVVYSRESLNGPIPPGGLTEPTVFADGLAIPLGVLPWGEGDACYVQHGHDLKLYKDADGDGRADSFELVLTGFGVQDSHLFPHQFTRAPGGWIWMAQGLFNDSKVHPAGSSQVVNWPKCSMARMRPDGSAFEVTSVGPNNIWGLAMSIGGEAFIQEANDYGYPVMPFREYTYYPSGMAAFAKSYQPDFPPQADFRMGGTGLSGLAFVESGPLADKQAAHTLAIANPILAKIQTLAMHRDGTWWKLVQLADFVTCDDPYFRPVALTNGPDGCLYIVDWYNKIISHNEVPRNHPDRDKSRGRIWRVRAARTAETIPDFTRLETEALSAMLDKPPVGRAHLAWQTLQDRGQLSPDHWGSQEYLANTRWGRIAQIGRSLSDQNIAELLEEARPSLPGPMGPSSRDKKRIPVREAYDRAFERFLVRMFLERQPGIVAKFLDSEAASGLPVENRIFASLALEPKASGPRVAALLPRLERAPNEEELLRLAHDPTGPGVGEALRTLLTRESSRVAVVKTLLARRTELDTSRLAPLLEESARQLLGTDPELALQLIGGFQLANLEGDLVALAKTKPSPALLTTLRDLRSAEADLFASIARSATASLTRLAALEALAASSAPDAGAKVFALYPSLEPAPRRRVLDVLSGSTAGAKAVVAALLNHSLPPTDLDGPVVERLASVLGEDPAVAQLQEQMGGVFREVLSFDGQDSAWVDSKISLDGPFTVEAWVRLAPGIGNEDSLLGAQGQIDLNFFQSRFRVWLGEGQHDVCISSKPIAPDLWTHLAVTRDAEGVFRIFQNGELDATGTKSSTAAFADCKIGWSGPNRGTEGSMTEFRVWNTARTAEQIRGAFDRSYASPGSHRAYPDKDTHLRKGVRIVKTIDTPPLLTEDQAKDLDTRFVKYAALAPKGDPSTGKSFAALCLACHQIGADGGQIGPNLSGVGAMGIEAILRNLLTPNAAMEPGYRIYRVARKNGDLIDAFFVSEDRDAVVVRQPTGGDQRIPRHEIESTRYIRRSLMPEGLLEALPDAQAADLLAYLLTLR